MVDERHAAATPLDSGGGGRDGGAPADGSSRSPGVATVGGGGVSLERRSTSGAALAAYALLLVALDAGKQLSGYALKYCNGGAYPLAPTLIVGCAEIVKVASTAGYLACRRSLSDVSFSLKFALPAALYACTNNVHLFAFHYTTPAVWNILTQSRIIITALAYRTLFKMHLGAVQWLALVLLTFAICFAQPMGGDGGGGSNASRSGGGGGSESYAIQPHAIMLALASSVLSVAAATFMEYTFKNDRRPFVDQQLQLSLYAALASLAFYAVEAKSGGGGASDAFRLWRGGAADATGLVLPSLLAACVALGAASGVVTGLVIAKLDNVVKIYSQALCGVVNAIVCTVAFPDNFRPDWRYSASLALVVASIFLYEKGSDACVAAHWTRWRSATRDVLSRCTNDTRRSPPPPPSPRQELK